MSAREQEYRKLNIIRSSSTDVGKGANICTVTFVMHILWCHMQQVSYHIGILQRIIEIHDRKRNGWALMYNEIILSKLILLDTEINFSPIFYTNFSSDVLFTKKFQLVKVRKPLELLVISFEIDHCSLF